jgi:hypothetical protein
MLALALAGVGVYLLSQEKRTTKFNPKEVPLKHLKYPGGVQPDPLITRSKVARLPGRTETHPSAEAGVRPHKPLSPELDVQRRKMLRDALPKAPPFHAGNGRTCGFYPRVKYGYHPGGAHRGIALHGPVHPAILALGPPPTAL